MPRNKPMPTRAEASTRAGMASNANTRRVLMELLQSRTLSKADVTLVVQALEGAVETDINLQAAVRLQDEVVDVTRPG